MPPIPHPLVTPRIAASRGAPLLEELLDVDVLLDVEVDVDVLLDVDVDVLLDVDVDVDVLLDVGAPPAPPAPPVLDEEALVDDVTLAPLPPAPPPALLDEAPPPPALLEDAPLVEETEVPVLDEEPGVPPPAPPTCDPQPAASPTSTNAAPTCHHASRRRSLSIARPPTCLRPQAQPRVIGAPSEIL